MGVRRHFLGWDGPIRGKVCGFLLADGSDLESTLVVVPTRQAGRRLREALALAGAARDVPVLGLRAVPPTFFLFSSAVEPREAAPLIVKAAWAETLLAADAAELGNLFPSLPAARDFAWALRLGETIQNLRASLAEGGYTIAAVVRDRGEALDEPERWADLARVEAAYLDRVGRLGLEDPCARRIRLSARPEPPEGVRRIVVAAVSDPTLLLIRALESLSATIDVDILIHAPPGLADGFDEWGRPVTDRWAGAGIDIPEPDRNLHLAASPAIQSRKALEEIGASGPGIGPDDIGIGVPDRDVIPYLAADLAERGLAAFDPAGQPVASSPLYRLIDALREVVTARAADAFDALIHHSDVLLYLEADRRARPRDLLREWDDFRGAHLPMNLDDIGSGLRRAGRDDAYPGVALALEFVLAQVRAFESSRLDVFIRAFLQAVYGVRSIRADNPGDAAFAEVAGLVDEALHELARETAAGLPASPAAQFDLLRRRLAEQSGELPRPAGAIDLEGWLELPWNDAPLLIVTGMNEGCVPDGRLSDMFLPDSLRRTLGLRHDAARFARDAYLLRAMIESRRAAGRVCLIAGRSGIGGDPLKPSRLLFLCPDAELPARAERLFGMAEASRDSAPLRISVRLNPEPDARCREAWRSLSKLRVTAFRGYLACPFRFYLRTIVGMEAAEAGKTALNDADFGEMVHHALHAMAADRRVSRSADERQLAGFLCGAVEQWMRARFGGAPPLMVEIQAEAARQRLIAAAREQARLADEGWEIVASECDRQAAIGGFTVTGRIDRIDRHRKTGVIRILDYKSSDKAVEPVRAHLGTQREGACDYARVTIRDVKRTTERQWVDLQLPLYRVLAAADAGGGPIEVGYFNLPKAVTGTGVAAWPDFDDDLAKSALACAEGVIADIRRGRFWPPSEAILYDDFETLFTGPAEECFDTSGFFGRAGA